MSQKHLRAFLEHLSQTALKTGASSVAHLPADQIVVDERVRFKCLVPRCSNYGTNLMCPPNIFTVKEFKRILSGYQSALLLKIESHPESAPAGIIEKDNLAEAWKTGDQASDQDKDQGVNNYIQGLRNSQRRVYQMLGRLESICLNNGYPLAAGLAGGGCHLCSECAGPGSACLHPFEARPAAEGLGVDVIATAKKQGFEAAFSNNQPPCWFAILLVD